LRIICELVVGKLTSEIIEKIKGIQISRRMENYLSLKTIGENYSVGEIQFCTLAVHPSSTLDTDQLILINTFLGFENTKTK